MYAVNEAFRYRPWVGSIEELQANFAFTKAYLADQSGSRAGLGGASCFVDLKLFSKEPPKWITFEVLIDWSTEGMRTTFGKLKLLDISRANKVRFLGILDAHEIATRLTQEAVETKRGRTLDL